MSKAKAKGTAFEREVCTYLAELVPTVERRALTGALDRGDVAGLPNWCVEIKNHARMELGAWVDEAAVEQRNARTRYSCVVHKRRGRNVAGAYVTMELEQFRELVGAP